MKTKKPMERSETAAELSQVPASGDIVPGNAERNRAKDELDSAD